MFSFCEIIIDSLWTFPHFCDIVCATKEGGSIHMVRKKQVNNENGAGLNRDFPRRSRSLFITEV